LSAGKTGISDELLERVKRDNKDRVRIPTKPAGD